MPRAPSIYQMARFQGRLWTLDLLRPALWLDWADASTISLATGISEVRDKSGNGRHWTQSTPASQPAYRRDGINGLGSVSFDGTPKALQRTPEAWAFQYPITSFIVFRAAAFTNAYNSLFEFFTSAGPTTAGWSDLIKSNGRSAVYSTNTAGTQPNYDGTGALTYGTNRTYIFCGIHQNNSLVGLQNGNTDGSNTGSYTLRTNLGTSALYIGSSPLFARYTNWMIGEVVIFNNAELPIAARNRILGHLGWKWGNAPDLATTNPFLNYPPLIGN
ncbi:MAG: hypothetical protein INF90_14730 [Roseomonas sp.]|jgi:hypothetical protein|nr:hypothetical protein [Roseomonas sp.]